MPDTSGTYLTISDANGSSDTLFGTASGMFALDSAAGAMIGVRKTPSKAFDPSAAATYRGLSYQKSNASMTGSSEAGSVILGKAAFIVDTSGTATLKDPTGNTVFSGTLTPVADATYLQGADRLNDPCNGLFTFRTTTGSGAQDVFVTFQGHAAIFWSFAAPAMAHQGGTYSYLYGIALR